MIVFYFLSSVPYNKEKETQKRSNSINDEKLSRRNNTTINKNIFLQKLKVS